MKFLKDSNPYHSSKNIYIHVLAYPVVFLPGERANFQHSKSFYFDTDAGSLSEFRSLRGLIHHSGINIANPEGILAVLGGDADANSMYKTFFCHWYALNVEC